VYAGIDPITKREIRLKATAKTEQQAHIEADPRPVWPGCRCHIAAIGAMPCRALAAVSVRPARHQVDATGISTADT